MIGGDKYWVCHYFDVFIYHIFMPPCIGVYFGWGMYSLLTLAGVDYFFLLISIFIVNDSTSVSFLPLQLNLPQ